MLKSPNYHGCIVNFFQKITLFGNFWLPSSDSIRSTNRADNQWTWCFGNIRSHWGNVVYSFAKGWTAGYKVFCLAFFHITFALFYLNFRWIETYWCLFPVYFRIWKISKWFTFGFRMFKKNMRRIMLHCWMLIVASSLSKFIKLYI